MRVVLLGVAIAGLVVRCAALPTPDWSVSEWLSVPEAAVLSPDCRDLKRGVHRAADGTSWFSGRVVNTQEVRSARWSVTGLGVFDVYVNGRRVGTDFLKPGFTHVVKTRVAFAYDVTDLMRTAAGAQNVFAAEVSAGWWRDKIVNFAGRKSAFRGVLELTYADGTTERFGTKASDWRCGIAGPVTHAGIYDGEEYDARRPAPVLGEGLVSVPEVNDEFRGEIVPPVGAEVCLRRDRMLKPVVAYCWKGVSGADGEGEFFGTVVRTRTFAAGQPLAVGPDETLVVDFGQNCAAVPDCRFRAAAGTVLTILPGEMLNDGNGERSRGNDGPAGSVYRENLRMPETGMHIVYTFPQHGDKVYWSDGRVTDESGRYAVENGRVEIPIRFADGDPEGGLFSKWKAVVTDLTTGEESTIRFTR